MESKTYRAIRSNMSENSSDISCGKRVMRFACRTLEKLLTLEFNVTDGDLNKMKVLDTRNMSDDKLNDFFSKYGRLYGGEPSYGYDYIIKDTNLGIKHYFNKRVFDKLDLKK